MIINIANRLPLLALAFVFSLGCGGATAISSEQAKAQAQALVPGEVLSVSSAFDAEMLLWEVKVRVANQAVLSVSFIEADGELYGIEDEVGPFDYELPRSRPEFVTYTEAKAKAMTSKTGGLVAWNLRYKPAGYRYEFYVRDSAEQLWEIKLSATTGEVTTVEPKAAID